jgi:signal transduction histidine kinase
MVEHEGSRVVSGDEGLLRQMFINLILNGFDAMPHGGVLCIRTRALDKDGSLMVTVADTGAGIPDEIIDRVFDPFFSTKDRGTGLGLAIVAAIVNAHGGAIDIASGKGKGAEFKITLPVAESGAIVAA